MQVNIRQLRLLSAPLLVVHQSATYRTLQRTRTLQRAPSWSRVPFSLRKASTRLMMASSSSSTPNQNLGGDEEQIKQQKKDLRKQIRSKMKLLSTEEIRTQSLKVWEQVMQLQEYQQATSIGLFLSMPTGEIDTDPIIEDCIRTKKTIWVPEVGANFECPDMDLRKVVVGSGETEETESTVDSSILFHKSWPKNKWSIPEPPPDMPRVIAKPGDIDLLIVPGLGFDTSKNRLGQGKGYYDRFIAKMESSTSTMPLVAVCLQPQLVEGATVPVASYDKTMNLVVLPDRVIT